MTRVAGRCTLSGLALLGHVALAGGLAAQSTSPSSTIVDTIVIEPKNVFDAQAAKTGAFRVMNRIHVVTHPGVIRSYLLIEKGEPYDSAAAAESERQLRLLQLFREVSIDSTRLEDGRLAAVVHTRDAWSLKPKLAYSVASTGDWTGTFGLAESNLLGTGNLVYAAYRKEIDRDGLNTSAQFRRIFGWDFDASGNFARMSDGKNGNWVLGLPFRNVESTHLYQLDGSSASQDVIQYVVTDAADSTVTDSTTYRRDAFINTLSAGIATAHSTARYLRFGADVGIRQEGFYLDPDEIGVVPDSLYGTVSLWSEYSKVRYQKYSRFNGFGSEDLDLSTTVRLTATLAPEGFGWNGTGAGLALNAAAGKVGLLGGKGWVWGAVDANYLWNAAVQDSGRIVFNVATGVKFAERHSTAAQLQWGRLWNAKPGDQFDLGFDNAPRGWPAHAFVGDRGWWVQLEHRFYAIDEFLHVVGLGLEAFVDYGGAWYPDQSSRTGGSLGAGVIFGSALSSVAQVTRIDVVYRFGPEVTGDRWLVAFGAGFNFPRRNIPVINYRAQPP